MLCSATSCVMLSYPLQCCLMCYVVLGSTVLSCAVLCSAACCAVQCYLLCSAACCAVQCYAVLCCLLCCAMLPVVLCSAAYCAVLCCLQCCAAYMLYITMSSQDLSSLKAAMNACPKVAQSSTVQSEVALSAQAGHGAPAPSSSAGNPEGNVLAATALHAHPAPQAAPSIQSTFRRLPSGLLGMPSHKAMQVHELGALSLHLSPYVLLEAAWLNKICRLRCC